MGGRSVMVWCLDVAALTPAAGSALDGLLAEDERDAIARSTHADHRRRAGWVRALAKGLLGSVTGTAADTWRLGRTADGVPLAMAPDYRRPPWLSLSRTGGAVAAAVSEIGPVGVDIERVAAASHAEAVAQALFAPVDRAAMRGSADAFTRIWTVKEAVLKALGTGFALPPAHVGVLSLDPLRIGFVPDYAEARGWSLGAAARGPLRVAAACHDGAGDARVVIRWMRVRPAAPALFEADPCPGYQ